MPTVRDHSKCLSEWCYMQAPWEEKAKLKKLIKQQLNKKKEYNLMSFIKIYV